METYSISAGWGAVDDPPHVTQWSEAQRHDASPGWWPLWSLNEVAGQPSVELEMWRHDDHDQRVYVIASGFSAMLCFAECPTFGDALQCVTLLLPLAQALDLALIAETLEELVGYAKAVLVDHGIPLPR